MTRSRDATTAITAVTLAALAALVAACSSSASDGGNSTNSGIHGRVAPVLAPGVATTRDTLPKTECGDPPYVDLALWMWELGDDGVRPLEGATLTFDACPTFDATTDAVGMLNAKVSRGVAVIPRLAAPGHVPIVVAESRLDGDSILSDFTPTLARTDVIPEYEADRPTLSVYLVAEGTGTCATESGVTLRIVDHPEARAIYMAPAWPRDPVPAGGDASVGTVVFFGGLTAGAPVSIEGTKPGCVVRVVPSEQTGRLTLEDGAWTVGNVYIDDP